MNTINPEKNADLNPLPRLDEQQALLQQARLSGYVGERARSSLIKANYSWIRQRCYQTLRNDADANDAAQDVAIKAYGALRQFEGRSALRTWLNSIVRNECINLIRKRQAAALSEHLEELLLIHEAERLHTAAEHDEALSFERVQEILSRLAAPAREVLLLRFYKEHSLQDIGQILGISLSASKMRLYRALDEFKCLYAELEFAAVASGEAKAGQSAAFDRI